MPLLKVKKVVAVCFLEAAKTTLEHLGALRLEQSQLSAMSSVELPRIYADVRRLRDYLQRCASAYQDQVELDLTESDQGLLVACCRRLVEVIDLRTTDDQVVPADERLWLQKKRQVIADWAVELAAKPLIELPLKRLMVVQTDAWRALNTRLQIKCFGDVNQRQKVVVSVPGQGSMMTGVQGVAEAATIPAAIERVGTPAPVSPPSAELESSATPMPIESQKLSDPRLRALVAIDLRTYERAVAAGDYRLGAVMLASLLEAAMLDHVIPRRAELGLTGTPDTWKPQELLLRVMDDKVTPKDRSLAHHLFSARNLLRPAMQMMTPSVVTVSSFDRLFEFVARALNCMGFKAPSPGPDASAIFSATSFPPED